MAATVASGITRRFTVREYERMVDGGVFVGLDRIELLDGEIVQKPQPGPRAVGCIVKLGSLLHRACGDGCSVGRQLPLVLDPMSEPEPDLLVFRTRQRAAHLTPDDILLMIEVADGSLAYDLDRKFPRYAAAAIPEAWLFDVFAGVLERHTEPFEGRYRRVETARSGESLPSTTILALTLAVDDILAEDE